MENIQIPPPVQLVQIAAILFGFLLLIALLRILLPKRKEWESDEDEEAAPLTPPLGHSPLPPVKHEMPGDTHSDLTEFQCAGHEMLGDLNVDLARKGHEEPEPEPEPKVARRYASPGR